LSLRNLTRFGSVGKSAVRIGNFPVIFIVLPGFSSFCPEEVLLLEKATLTPDTIPNKMQVLSRTASAPDSSLPHNAPAKKKLP
jgi:hypothetical protein